MKENQRFERIEVSRDEALGMFTENKFKVRPLMPCRLDFITSCISAMLTAHQCGVSSSPCPIL